MNKEELAKAINEAHEALDRLVNPLSEEQMSLPGAWGIHTAKDLLAHLAAWEQMEAQWLEASLQGKTPVRFTPDYAIGDSDPQAVMDQLNEHIIQVNKGKPLERVRADLRAGKERVLAVLARLSDADLEDVHRFDWWDGEPIWTSIAENTTEHIYEHMEDLQRWLENRAPRSEG